MKNDLLKKSKLLVYFRKIDNKEFKELGLWVRSPFLNSNKNVIKLYEVLKNKYRKTDRVIEYLDLMRFMGIVSRSTKEKDVSPKHRQELRKVMSALATQIEELFIWKKTKEDKIRCKYELMNALEDRDLNEQLPAVLNKARKIHQSSPLRNIKHLENSHYIADIDYETTYFSKRRKRVTGIKLAESVDALRQFCLVKLLRYYRSLINVRDIFKIDYNRSFIELMMTYLSKNNDINTFTIRVYYLLLKVSDTRKIDDYYELKNILFSQLDAFDTLELRNMLIGMRNYCTIMSDSNRSIFFEEIFSIDVKGLDYGCWLIDSFFSDERFMLIFTNALSLNKTKWAGTFLKQYGSQIRPDLRENTLNYCQALYSFHCKKYDKAQEYLNKLGSIKDIFNTLRIKILLIQIYYDKNEFNQKNTDSHPINHELEAIKQYALPSTNNKMSERLRKRYSNFANFFKRILNRKKKLICNEPLTLTNIKILKKDLSNMKSLVVLNWLEEKVNELMEEVAKIA